MLAAIKMEVMAPSAESPDEGSIGYDEFSCRVILLFHLYFLVSFVFYRILIYKFVLFSAIDFQMPPICSPLVRPGRPAETAPVVSKQLSDTIIRYVPFSFKSLFQCQSVI